MARGGMLIFDGIGPTLDILIATSGIRAMGAMEEGAARIQAHAQSTAPWSDITGQARNGLTTEIFDEAGEIVLELFHTADHGYWLELIQDGRFAVIMPTLELLGPEVLAEAGASVLSIQGDGF